MNSRAVTVAAIIVVAAVAVIGWIVWKPRPGGGFVEERCKGVNGLAARELTGKWDLDQSRSFATKLIAAAEADVDAMKNVKQLNADGSLGAKLGAEIRGVVETKASVTTEFFQQDLSFTQAACWMDSILDRKLSPSDRTYFEGARQKLAANRLTYLDLLTGLKKK